LTTEQIDLHSSVVYFTLK